MAWNLEYSDDEGEEVVQATHVPEDLPTARPLASYLLGFGVICRRLLRSEPFSSAPLGDDIVDVAVEGVDAPKKKATKMSQLESDAALPFGVWLVNMMTLQFNPDVRRNESGDFSEASLRKNVFLKMLRRLPRKTFIEKCLATLTLAAGLVEVTLFSIARISMLAVDVLDYAIFKPVAKLGYSVLSQGMGWEDRSDRYENRNTWLATFLKGTVSLFTLPVMFVWHFAVSKPLSVTVYAESRATKVLYAVGLLLIVGLVIGFSCGLGSVPVFGAALAKMGFIQIAGDAIAAGFSSFLAPITTAAFAEGVGLYFSWMAVVGAWKFIASAFLKLMSFGPVIREELIVRSELSKEAKFNKEAGFVPYGYVRSVEPEGAKAILPNTDWRNSVSPVSQGQASESFYSEYENTKTTVMGSIVESDVELSNDEDDSLKYDGPDWVRSPSYVRNG